MRHGIQAVFFDLDGTLLPMDQDAFTTGYFKFLVKKAAGYGYKAEELIQAIWHGTGAMVKNDGSCTNEEAFWADFTRQIGSDAAADKPVFESFYANEFQQARSLCGFAPRAAEIVAMLHSAGVRVILATNPLFPAVATESRIGWAGLHPEDFELITTYENISYSKPNPDYYREILRRTGLQPEACVMVGNDVDEDMVAAELGMDVFLLTDCLINRAGKPIDCYPHGGFDALERYLRERLALN